MKQVTAEEVEKRLRAWADVTLLSLELKHATLKKKYPALDDQTITTMMRERHAAYGDDGLGTPRLQPGIIAITRVFR